MMMNKEKSRSHTASKARWVFPLLVLMILVTFTTVAAAATLTKPDSNISYRLQALSDNLNRSSGKQVSLGTLGLAESGPFSLMKNQQGQLLVYIRVTDTTRDNIQALEESGAVITHTDDRYKIVTAYIGLADLKSLSSLSFVKNISEVLKPLTRQADYPGAVTSEGDMQLRAEQARALFSVDGTGVTVGVLSDSYDGVTTPTSAADDILSGDLPGANNPCGRTDPVVVLEDYITSDSTDEGRAMMQIVHDLAPGAKLAFATAFSGLFSFADNIIKLRNRAGADVIVDDVSYFNEPIFQDGPVSTAITSVTKAGAKYFTSAGNSNAVDGDGHNISSYEAPAFRPTTCPRVFLNGDPTPIGDACHNFDPNGDTAYQEFTLADLGYFIMAFQWAEPWFGVDTDLDLFVTDSAYNILTFSADTNPGDTGTQVPFEAVQFQNTTGATGTFRIIIARYTGTNAPRSKYVLFRSHDILSSRFNASNSTDIFGPSVSGHSGAADALSIAAVPYNDPETPEYYTSHGYFTVYYKPVSGTTPAGPLAVPEIRYKPDFTATDGGANTFFGQQDGSVYRFYGTSAAAPHAAAVAALLDQAYRTAVGSFPSPNKVENAMEKSAATIPNGDSTISGAGLLDAVAAILQVIDFGGQGAYGGSGGNGGCFISVSD